MTEKTTEHTPGPWEVVKHGWSETSICPGNDSSWPICTLEIDSDVTEQTQDEFEKKVAANAHLIAAAPDMLKALERIIKWNDLEWDGSGKKVVYVVFEHHAAMDAGRAAIAKAKGETE